MITAYTRRFMPLAAALCLISLFYCWESLGRPSTTSDLSWNVQLDRPQKPNVFDIFDPVPFQPESIAAVCSATQWTPGLVFTCDRSVGGVGNLRNSILACVRYAIQAGAALTLPKIILRNPSDITIIRGGAFAEFDYMFDRQHFVDSLRLACPQLILYSFVNAIPNHAFMHRNIEPLLPEDLFESIPITGVEQPELFRPRFYDWLQTRGGIQNLTILPERPAVVALKRSYMQYPIYSDGVPFAHNFGRILRPRNDAYTVAQHVLEALATRHALPLAPARANTQQPIPSKSFLGLHLRTEKDATDIWQPSNPTWNYSRYDIQRSLFLSFATTSNLSILYIASGNDSEVAKFRNDAMALASGVDVVTKFSLLRDHLEQEYQSDTTDHIGYRQDLHTLGTMTWDQQSLVDFLVMQRAAHFCGVAHSSFAWNIAIKRHVYSSMQNESLYLDGPQMFNDEFSTVFGRPRGYPEYALCLWP